TVTASTYAPVKGVAVAIVATASTGYEFSGWTVVSGSATFADASADTTTVTLRSNSVIQANFAAMPVLTVQYQAEGSDSRATGVSYVKSGVATSITALPVQDNYEFWKWTTISGTAVFGNSLSAATTVAITSSATVQANYLRLNDLVLDTSGKGNVSANGALTDLTILDTVTVSGTASSGWVFVKWVADTASNIWIENSSSKTTRVAISGDVTLTAVFSPRVTAYEDGCGDANADGRCHNPSQAGPDFQKVWVTNGADGDSLFFLLKWCSLLDFETDQYLYLDLDPVLGDSLGYDRRYKLEYVRTPLLSDTMAAMTVEDYTQGSWQFVDEQWSHNEADSRSSVPVFDINNNSSALADGDVAEGDQQVPDSSTAEAGTLLELEVPMGQERTSVRWTIRGSHDDVASLLSPNTYTLVPDGMAIVVDGDAADWMNFSSVAKSSSSAESSLSLASSSSMASSSSEASSSSNFSSSSEASSSSSAVVSSSSNVSSDSVATITAYGSNDTLASGSCVNIDVSSTAPSWLSSAYFRCNATNTTGVTQSISFNGSTTIQTDIYNGFSLNLGALLASNVCVQKSDGNSLTCLITNY
ncbi:MAG TPA: hypothetical protein VLM37_00455, partial [Fibrobacteraceae bacterium]|nr:hypothetical protein [Fibrobacteraceae bacterium]